ncbi:MAG TPA: LuxR C-terminal-related transcriptional regulator [Pseudonocardia sp.]|jgi:two-component system nitrate/nitrite response regulator NarL|uniref:LuxR C-terminal-related transcriptional regulator n=1 Tax=Pseudonocardia sp. TaxID=60912 RepID=UPI002C033431|nr:LuxR C-terminal-related transcriptional regulator [Pseudonocardia sp.]HTF51082.1 LuxR C-terminal-related transcriptional regulator [Pseudonocardia sp.]
MTELSVGRPGNPEVAHLRVRPEEQGRVAQLMQQLIPREQEVLGLLVDGHRAAAVAELCGMSLSSVHDRIQAILAKLEVRSQLEAVAVVLGLLNGRGSDGAPERTA